MLGRKFHESYSDSSHGPTLSPGPGAHNVVHPSECRSSRVGQLVEADLSVAPQLATQDAWDARPQAVAAPRTPEGALQPRPCPSGIPRWHTALPAASANVALDTQTGVGSSYIGRGEGEIGGYGSVMHDVEPGRAGSSRSRPAPKDYKPLTLPDGRLATLGTHTHRTRTHTHILAHTRRGH